ncbi:flagellar hook-length control protein [Gottschalkia purinilytica]|uniref:Flagellar hook-length control protein n=1 Tax=Gottschalkia purinilytica TaxID=1503 RepID=A0A0L0WBF6_GOTPU|nr:flagellar hook-length control protein FliK [Gottschalkia purinilytica]KNF08816.1 flagellar hook-length control protein [Gottschalkia purinilytica]
MISQGVNMFFKDSGTTVNSNSKQSTRDFKDGFNKILEQKRNNELGNNKNKSNAGSVAQISRPIIKDESKINDVRQESNNNNNISATTETTNKTITQNINKVDSSNNEILEDSEVEEIIKSIENLKYFAQILIDFIRNQTNLEVDKEQSDDSQLNIDLLKDIDFEKINISALNITQEQVNELSKLFNESFKKLLNEFKNLSDSTEIKSLEDGIKILEKLELKLQDVLSEKDGLNIEQEEVLKEFKSALEEALGKEAKNTESNEKTENDGRNISVKNKEANVTQIAEELEDTNKKTTNIFKNTDSEDTDNLNVKDIVKDTITKVVSSDEGETVKVTVEKNNSNNQVIIGEVVKEGEGIQNFKQIISKATLLRDDNIEINQNDIINQITDKMKATYNDKLREIKINLKPENLGALTIKISLERGIVNARAIVENYNVKQIMESNLDQLKDSLKGQGINFDTLDVYVGQDSAFEKQSSNNWNQNKKVKVKKNKVESLEANELYENSEEILSPLISSESSLDVTV